MDDDDTNIDLVGTPIENVVLDRCPACSAADVPLDRNGEHPACGNCGAALRFTVEPVYETTFGTVNHTVG